MYYFFEFLIKLLIIYVCMCITFGLIYAIFIAGKNKFVMYADKKKLFEKKT